MKAEEIRKKSEKEARDLLKNKRRKLVDLKLKLKTEELQDTSQIKKTKKDIARIMTVLNKT